MKGNQRGASRIIPGPIFMRGIMAPDVPIPIIISRVSGGRPSLWKTRPKDAISKYARK